MPDAPPQGGERQRYSHRQDAQLGPRSAIRLRCPWRPAAETPRIAAGGSSFEMVPKMVFGAEALDLVKLDVGALGPGGRRTGDPPLGAGQSG